MFKIVFSSSHSWKDFMLSLQSLAASGPFASPEWLALPFVPPLRSVSLPINTAQRIIPLQVMANLQIPLTKPCCMLGPWHLSSVLLRAPLPQEVANLATLDRWKTWGSRRLKTYTKWQPSLQAGSEDMSHKDHASENMIMLSPISTSLPTCRDCCH